MISCTTSRHRTKHLFPILLNEPAKRYQNRGTSNVKFVNSRHPMPNVNTNTHALKRLNKDAPLKANSCHFHH
jgi:uncharacterized Fe-S radical SAM superfamily protein PflX